MFNTFGEPFTLVHFTYHTAVLMSARVELRSFVLYGSRNLIRIQVSLRVAILA